MKTREELLEALLVERYDNRWWKTPDGTAPDYMTDNELNGARRRREIAEAMENRRPDRAVDRQRRGAA